MTARILTWNVERKRPDSSLGKKGIELLFDQDPDVMVITEARTSFPASGGHTLWCEPPRGTTYAEDERKVLMWSKEPWREVDSVGVEGLDQSRFISAITDTSEGPIRVLGVCIPWHMAEVTYPIDVKRKPWELHIRYLELIAGILSTGDIATVVAGDFNQAIPRIKYGNKAASEAMAETFVSLDIVTQGTVDGGTRPGIDHIAVTKELQPSKVWGWPNEVEGHRLSDHDGAGVDLSAA